MFPHHVRTPEDAFLYMTDCTLATVRGMAIKKTPPKYEFERQISIAQTAVDWIKEMHLNTSTIRANDVILLHNGSVKDWVNQYRADMEKK